ncbi:extracellular solute-binding protein [Paenibacillus spongiae]|uniref:Extracellular solute-binding protein n=1 Tax=Paenibacillus spongiae TaxID=2909671 RepID=A0ABY5SLM4_9BACL|nr:extracellular solute-binding protein [Paenibacillus spongiae]UVI33420.1 extracellular solute-binding protein [Paenibacillus spongiae]
MRKKGLKVSLAVVLSSTMLFAAGCGNTDSSAGSNGNSQKPGEETRKELRMMVGTIGGKTPDEHELFEKEAERLTGIKVTMEKPASGFNDKLLTSISSGEKYDLVQVDLPLLEVLYDQGVLTPLDDSIKGSKIISDTSIFPENEWEQLKMSDGKIYGIFTKLQGGTMPTVRKDWLDKLGLQEPKTLDEYYEVLKAFKEKDPDGNGKADTYGLSTAGLYDIQGFMSAAGVKAGYVTKDGKRTIPYATEAAIPIYEWFAKLYKEGILDPNFATNDSGKMRDLFLTDRVGMVTYWDTWVGTFNNTRKQQDPNTTFEAKGLLPVAGPDGKILMRRGEPNVWIIPVNSPDPKTAMEFIEFWSTEKGNVFATLGIEGHDYTVTDGKYELTQDGKDHNLDHGAPYVYNTNWTNPFGSLPGVKEAKQLVMEYGTVEKTGKDWKDIEKIINNYALQAMQGKIPAADAVSKMNKELKAAKFID